MLAKPLQVEDIKADQSVIEFYSKLGFLSEIPKAKVERSELNQQPTFAVPN